MCAWQLTDQFWWSTAYSFIISSNILCASSLACASEIRQMCMWSMVVAPCRSLRPCSFFCFLFLKLSNLFFCLFYFLAMPCGMWDPSSLTRDWTGTTAVEGRFLTTGPPGKSFPSYSFLFLIFVVDGCLFTRVSEFISAESIWLSSSKIRVFSLIINLYYKYLFFSPGEIFTLNLDKNLSSKQLWNVGWCNKPG